MARTVTTRTISYRDAIREAMFQAMEQDPRVFLMGEGVDDPKAIFGTTSGLKERFGPERVFDIPLAENAMTGVGVGSALTGMRPVMTHQRLDFTLYAMDQIVNQAAKRHYASGGLQSVPFTIRAVVGRGWGQGSQHSQSLQAWFAHVPGLKVVMPSTPYDAKGLLLESIADDNPVVSIEYRKLHDEQGHVPEDAYRIPLGEGIVRREGKDVTVVAISYMNVEAWRAGEALKRAGIEVEIIDPRSLRPLDEEIILRSLEKTGRLVVADTAWPRCSISSEVAALAAEKGFHYLKAPVRRVTLPDVPTPTSHVLEAAFYPGASDITKAVCEVVDLDGSAADEIVESIGEAETVAPTFVGPF